MEHDMKKIRRELKKLMLKAGIKDFSITGGKGTSWDWTHINKDKIGRASCRERV